MRFTPHFHRTLAAWEKSAAGPVELLHAIQRERLFRLAERARRHVRYYRDLPPPRSARDPAEAIARTLAAWPPLEKASYRDAAKFIARDLPGGRMIRGEGTSAPRTQTALRLVTPSAGEESRFWRQRPASRQPGDPSLNFAAWGVVNFRTNSRLYARQSWGGQTSFPSST